MKIFVLDDQPGWADTVAWGLAKAGYDAHGYFHVPHLMDKIHQVDLLIVDYHLPGTTGVELVCRAFNQGWQGGAIVTTPYPRQAHLDHPSIRMRLLKPYDVPELIEAIALIQADIAISRWHRSTNELLLH